MAYGPVLWPTIRYVGPFLIHRLACSRPGNPSTKMVKTMAQGRGNSGARRGKLRRKAGFRIARRAGIGGHFALVPSVSDIPGYIQRFSLSPTICRFFCYFTRLHFSLLFARPFPGPALSRYDTVTPMSRGSPLYRLPTSHSYRVLIPSTTYRPSPTTYHLPPTALPPYRPTVFTRYVYPCPPKGDKCPHFSP